VRRRCRDPLKLERLHEAREAARERVGIAREVSRRQARRASGEVVILLGSSPVEIIAALSGVTGEHRIRQEQT
jgi:hypothetical protein